MNRTEERGFGPQKKRLINGVANDVWSTVESTTPELLVVVGGGFSFSQINYFLYRDFSSFFLRLPLL